MAFQTLAQLRTKVRQKAGIENDGKHISDSEVDTYIQDAIYNLWNRLYDNTDGSLFAKLSDDLLAIGPNRYQLPDDFERMVEISTKIGSEYVKALEADPEQYGYLASQAYPQNTPAHFFIHWNTTEGRAELTLFPFPTNANLVVRYVPTAPEITLDTDTLKLPGFWYMWVVYDAAIQAQIKEEDDTSNLRAERDRIEQSILRSIDNIKLTRVQTIRKLSTQRRFRLPDPDFA